MTRTLRLDGVDRSFGDRQVLRNVSFEVSAGRMTGFVGANGAGKTTTMRIILGVLAPDAGEVSWGGTTLTRQDRRRFGYMPEERGLYPKMTTREQVAYLGRLHGLDAAAARRSTDALLDRVGLGERGDDLLETLSLGNQQRAQIAAALVHDPEVLVLDEPFSGLDPLAVETVVAVLRERASAGAPVLFSSHQLDVVERLCDDLVIIGDGVIRAAGSRQQLRDSYTVPRFELVVEHDAGWVRDHPGVTLVELDGARVVFDLPAGTDEQPVLRAALARGPVRAFRPVSPSLTEIFREVTQ
ncbi:ATP-binding cassette domain-containing protein [Micromonospora noduli]|uniref:Iron-chelate-transporting ATPase n=1 Tax=Micromonospora noduli TaxID=709876 RepID=A0A328NCZ2_9ACTN|nr:MULTISPECIES: ATP-binding cassette domain-containing protein [Micromonospora]WTI10441.1 ATP-binding cassette domain-containing protein [Micromonospora sp. NBC_00821]KAB1924138.1 ATP-binding cassette domain-containing protein [Micromonospora noduli]MCG5448247.1 ATP-binding cassette domain-containing protein [Micromonospora hortensis]MCX5117471.1 ATP-binding cassette domain-containing protein [Micromonospora sp. NBC_00362]RAO03520.1 Iron-chelate-transporting ATPase [Micromonospora noduli]